jgi:poly(A) polymerase
MSDRYRHAPPEELRPPKLLTGNDLIAAGYRPGPEFSKVLAAVEDAQLEQKIATKEEALALVRADFGDPR